MLIPSKPDNRIALISSRVAGGVSGTEFKPLALRGIGIFGDSDRSRAVGKAIEQLHWGFKSRQQSLKAVCGRVGERHQSSAMAEEPINQMASLERSA